jgi:hypothetical protein
MGHTESLLDESCGIRVFGSRLGPFENPLRGPVGEAERHSLRPNKPDSSKAPNRSLFTRIPYQLLDVKQICCCRKDAAEHARRHLHTVGRRILLRKGVVLPISERGSLESFAEAAASVASVAGKPAVVAQRA